MPSFDEGAQVTRTAFDDHVRSQWAGKATTYHASLAALCAHPAGSLLDAAGVEAGIRLLDAGTGAGTVAALACSRGAEVVAVDAESSMLELASHHAPGAALCQTELPYLPFPDGSFDAAVANFVINHVGHPGAAIGELHRVVRPGGRLAVTIWPYPAPHQQLWSRIFDEAGVERPADLPTLAPERDFPRTREGLADLLGRTGLFTDIRCRTLTWTHRTDPDAWWCGPASGLGTLGVLMQRQSPGTIDRIRQQYDLRITAHREADGQLALPAAALLASAVAN